jgi:hypothetical protein
MKSRPQPAAESYFTGAVARPGQPALPPEIAKPTIKDLRQIDLVDALSHPKKSSTRSEK